MKSYPAGGIGEVGVFTSIYSAFRVLTARLHQKQLIGLTANF